MKPVHLVKCCLAASVFSLLAVSDLSACSHDSAGASDPSTAGTAGTVGAAGSDAGSGFALVNANAPPPAPGAMASDAGAAPVVPSAANGLVSSGGLSIDQAAPDFDVKDQDGKELTLAQLHGHSVVLYFYPKDETPGCTKEACSFRDTWEQMDKEGVVLIGVSADSDDSHKKFAANHKLPFHLVSDPQGALAGKYGVPFKGYTSRQTFLISPEGTLRRIYRTVNVDGHAQDIANAVRT